MYSRGTWYSSSVVSFTLKIQRPIPVRHSPGFRRFHCVILRSRASSPKLSIQITCMCETRRVSSVEASPGPARVACSHRAVPAAQVSGGLFSLSPDPGAINDLSHSSMKRLGDSPRTTLGILISPSFVSMRNASALAACALLRATELATDTSPESLPRNIHWPNAFFSHLWGEPDIFQSCTVLPVRQVLVGHGIERKRCPQKRLALDRLGFLGSEPARWCGSRHVRVGTQRCKACSWPAQASCCASVRRTALLTNRLITNRFLPYVLHQCFESQLKVLENLRHTWRVLDRPRLPRGPLQRMLDRRRVRRFPTMSLVDGKLRVWP